MEHLTPRRMVVYPRRYRHRLQSHWPPEEDEVDETNVTTKGGNDLMARRNSVPLPIHTQSPAPDTKIKSKYTMKIPIGPDIEPKDVSVQLDAKHHTVTVNAKKEKRSEDGSCRWYKAVSRTISIPVNIDLKDAKSFLTTDGAIKIEAPFQRVPVWKRNFLFPGDWDFRWSTLLGFLIYAFLVYLLFLFFVYTT